MTWDTPFWPVPPPLPPARAPRRAEVAVVGGGITGLSVLRELQRHGVAAVLLERAHVAAGASGRNAGFLLTGTAEHYATAVAAHGREVAREVWAFTAANHELLLAALGEEGAHRAGHRRAGAWTLAHDRAQRLGLEEAAALLAEDGLAGSFVGEPGGGLPGCLGGLLSPLDGEIDPAAAVGELARLCVAEAPGCVVEGTVVDAVEAHSGEVRVHTNDGEVVAGAVILATNAWAAELAQQLPIRPVRAQMLATAAGPSAAPGPHRPAYSHRGHRYWRRLGGGEVLLGGCRELAGAEEEVGDAITTARVQGHLDSFLRSDLRVEAPVTHRWAGIMGFSPDGLPLVGPIPGMANVLICGGYTGHGFGFAVNAARTLVAHLSGGAPIPAWLDPARADLSVSPVP